MTDIKNPAGQETQVLTAAPNSESTGDLNLKGKETLQEYSGHDNGDADYNHASQGVRFSVLGLAVVLTLGFSVVELIGGLWANSLALVGDAGHMVTDSASLLFALVANIISRKGVDYNHSFGHGRIEVLAAFVNGIAMLAVVVWIFVEALDRIQNPPPIAGGSVMIVAVIGLLIILRWPGLCRAIRKTLIRARPSCMCWVTFWGLWRQSRRAL